MLQENMDFQKDGYHGEVIGEATPDILVSRFVSPLKPIFVLASSLVLINYHPLCFCFFLFLCLTYFVCISSLLGLLVFHS